MNNTINSSELFELLIHNSFIPLIQRNYCWSTDNITNFLTKILQSFRAGKEYHPAGMVSLYKNDTGRWEILDGQQRLTTLRILLKVATNDDLIDFDIERDTDCIRKRMRVTYIKDTKTYEDNGVTCCEAGGLDTRLPDLKRIYCSVEHIFKFLRDVVKSDTKEFVNYICNNLEFMLNIVEDEPMSEFLNMNTKKIPFRRYDKLRSCCLILSKDRKEVNDLFLELSSKSFKPEYKNLLEILTNTGCSNPVGVVDLFFTGKEYEYIQLNIDVDRELVAIRNKLLLLEDILQHPMKEDIIKVLVWYNEVCTDKATLIELTNLNNVKCSESLIFLLLGEVGTLIFNLIDTLLGVNLTSGFGVLLSPHTQVSMLHTVKVSTEEQGELIGYVLDYFKHKGVDSHESRLSNFSF